MPKTDKQSRALTAAFVASVRNPGKYHDGKGMGLFLLVKPSGARSWVQRVTIRGKRRDIGLGSPPVVTLAEAREVAMDNKRLARSGEDPLAVRQMTHADADLRRGRKGNSQGAFTNLEELEGSRLLPVHFAVLHVSQIWVDAVTRCDRRRPKASHTRCASESARCGEKNSLSHLVSFQKGDCRGPLRRQSHNLTGAGFAAQKSNAKAPKSAALQLPHSLHRSDQGIASIGFYKAGIGIFDPDSKPIRRGSTCIVVRYRP